MNRIDPPWLSPPAIVQPHVRPARHVSEARILEAITAAVRHAIDVVGIEGLKRTSMFPSSSRRLAADDERRRLEAADEAARTALPPTS